MLIKIKMSKGYYIRWTKYPDTPPAYNNWKVTFVLHGKAHDNSTESDQNNIGSNNKKVSTASREKICYSEIYQIHKCVIGPMSDYFDAVFQQSFKESCA